MSIYKKPSLGLASKGMLSKGEKQVKAGSRKKKIDLIIRLNPKWKDLSELLNANKGEELIRIKKYLS